MPVRALLLAITLAIAGVAAADTPQSTLIDRNAAYPEGPLWRDGALYVAEMGADRIARYADGRKRTFWRRPGCGPTSLAPYGEGLLVTCHLTASVVLIDARGRILRSIDRDDSGDRFRDPNDSASDGRGGIYFSDPGDFNIRTRPHGAVVHISADGAVRRVAENLWYPNGVFVADGALYLSETFHRRVLRYPINEDGSLGEPHALIDTAAAPPAAFEEPYAEAGPDGLEIAPDGDLYVAIYGEGRVLRYTPDGVYRGAFSAPARYLTNIAFDPDGNAYVTGAFDNITPPFPGEVRRFPASALPRP